MHFFHFFFVQNIAQSMVPNIEKFAIQQTVLRANCSDCEIQIYKV